MVRPGPSKGAAGWRASRLDALMGAKVCLWPLAKEPGACFLLCSKDPLFTKPVFPVNIMNLRIPDDLGHRFRTIPATHSD